MLPKIWTPNGVGIFWVSFCLVALFFVEPLLSRRSYHFKSSELAPAPLKKIPLNTDMAVVLPGARGTLKNKKRTDLETLFASQRKPSKLLLINFWATWCDPCVEEIPSLNWLSRQLIQNNEANLPDFVTISVDEKPQVILQLEKNLGSQFDFPVLHDPDGAFSKTLGILKFPETFLVNSEGTILYKWIGPQDWQSQEIITLLASFSKS